MPASSLWRTDIQLGILLALACAIVTNLAFFCKQRGAALAPRVLARHPWHSGRALFRVRWFAVGMLIAALAWLLHVAAMALAPLSLVQVVLAGGIVLIGVMADRVFGFRVGRRQWLGLALHRRGPGRPSRSRCPRCAVPTRPSRRPR